jgi:hypothetical protein
MGKPAMSGSWRGFARAEVRHGEGEHEADARTVGSAPWRAPHPNSVMTIDAGEGEARSVEVLPEGRGVSDRPWKARRAVVLASASRALSFRVIRRSKFRHARSGAGPGL